MNAQQEAFLRDLATILRKHNAELCVEVSSWEPDSVWFCVAGAELTPADAHDWLSAQKRVASSAPDHQCPHCECFECIEQSITRGWCNQHDWVVSATDTCPAFASTDRMTAEQQRDYEWSMEETAMDIGCQ